MRILLTSVLLLGGAPLGGRCHFHAPAARCDRPPDVSGEDRAAHQQRRWLRRAADEPAGSAVVHALRRRHRDRAGRHHADVPRARDLPAHSQQAAREPGAGAAAAGRPRRPAGARADRLRHGRRDRHADDDGAPECGRQAGEAPGLRAGRDRRHARFRPGRSRRARLSRGSSPAFRTVRPARATSRGRSPSTSRPPTARRSPAPPRSCGR